MDVLRPEWSRRWIVRGLLLIVTLLLLTPAGLAAVSATTQDESDPFKRGTIASPANGTTVVAVQGYKFQGKDSGPKPARLVAFGPRGGVQWVHEGQQVNAVWFYDVDPLNDGHLLVTAVVPATQGTSTIVYEFAPTNESILWTERFPYNDTHDVDLINGDQLLIANMRNYNASTGQNNDRILIYDRSNNTVVWEWLFRNHYNRSEHRETSFGRGGQWTDDWSHVNDIDKVGPGEYLASPRNFDQVILINRSTGAIDLQLGTDNNHSILNEQHNPQYLESQSGTPTVLVSDSGNDRIVEYERRNGEWVRTWRVGSSESLTWPRDADRLPNGNTLIVDTTNNRVIEVTPTGEIVWEVTAPWAPYDVERIPYGDESGGPTITDQNASGSYALSGSAGVTPGTGNRTTFSQTLQQIAAGTVVEPQVDWLAVRWAHTAPWIYPVWMTGWDFAGLVGAALLLLGWGVGEVILHRQTLLQSLQRRLV